MDRLQETIDFIETEIDTEIVRQEPKLKLGDLLLNFGNEQYQIGRTPIGRIRHILDLLQVAEGDTVFDLGSGYGEVVLIGALLFEAQFIGIEIVPERHAVATRISRLLGLDNATFLNSNVTDCNFAGGNKFYMFSPFFMSTLTEACRNLERIARNKTLTIVGVSHAALFLHDLPWLMPVPAPLPNGGLTVFDFAVERFQSRP